MKTNLRLQNKQNLLSKGNYPDKSKCGGEQTGFLNCWSIYDEG